MRVILRLLILFTLLVTDETMNFKRFVDYMIEGTDVEGFCEQCEAVLRLLKTEPQGTLKRALEACKQTQYFTSRICDEEHRVYAGPVLRIIEQLNTPLKEACNFLSNGFCGAQNIEIYKWTVHLDSVQDDASLHRQFVQHNNSEWGNSHFSMLHITDTHYDADYEVGATADCNEPMCCTKYQPQTMDPSKFAAPWGYPYGRACNVPFRTVENMLQDISRKRNVSFGIWTGDSSAHFHINATQERVVRVIEKTTAVFKRYLGQVKIFPAIGNHDAYPGRLFPQPGIEAAEYSVKPLYEEMWNLWYDWLPADQEQIFKHGGYYTAKVHDRLRIIALNTNFCYLYNWWLVLGANDPGRQLQWMINTLEEARRNRERVFIIGHIPPGSTTCNDNWEEAYYKIVTKFQHTITGQFFAHMHNDEVILDYSDPADKEKPTSVVYVTPTVTTSWSGMPEYRIYQTKFGEVVDIETYFLNLTTANEGYLRIRESLHNKVREDLKKMSPFRRRAMEKVLYGVPHWELGYSARKSYGLKKFDAQHWHQLIKAFDTDDDLLQRFFKHYTQFRENIVSQARPCDEICKLKLVREMTSKRSRRARERRA